jgi:hypothetical protein
VKTNNSLKGSICDVLPTGKYFFLYILYDTWPHEMCHAKYSTWLYIYIFLININVNKRETLIKQIGYNQVYYKYTTFNIIFTYFYTRK